MDNVSVTNHYASYSEIAWERANTQLGEEAIRIADGILAHVPHQPRRQTPLADTQRPHLMGSHDGEPLRFQIVLG